MADEHLNMEAVKVHNEYRAKHKSPPVKYNENIAKVAQSWANHLAQSGRLQHNNTKYGENIYMCGGKKGSIKDACDSWYSEKSKYPYDHRFTPGTGHFTQVVWKDSTEIGVGMAKGKGETYYIVANYNPPGNVQGRYKDNVVPPS